MKSNFNHAVQRKGTGCIKWDFQEMDYGVSGLLPFSIADADYAMCQEISTALVHRIESSVLGYTDPDESYYESVKSWFLRRHNWIIDKSWITTTNGIVPSMGYAIDVFTKPGAKILVQPPVYDPFFSIITATGREIVTNNLIIDGEENYGIDFEDLELKLAEGVEMMLFCNPHNPVCRVWSQSELQQVAALCKKYRVLIVSDEIHWDLMLGGSKHVTMGSIEEIQDILVVCTSPSKTFNIAGLQTSNIIIPNPEIREKYQGFLYSRYLFSPNALGLEACKAAYTYGEKWVDEQLSYLTESAETVVTFFKEKVPLAKVAKPEGTYLLWIDLSYLGLSGKELVSRIASQGAAVNNGHHYGNGFDGYIRMNIACPRAQLLAGLDAILRAINEISIGG